MILKPLLTGVAGKVTFCGPMRFFSSTGPKSKNVFIVIMGPPGSGKGTISERIVRDFNLLYLASGDVLRSHINNNTEFGAKIKPIVASGKLVPSSLLTPMIEAEIAKLKSTGDTGFLLDGFPRSVDQAESLQKTHPPDLAIQLDVPFETIINRIKSRWIHMPSGRVYNLDYNPPKVSGKDDVSGDTLTQREDDKPESVTKRLEVYQSVMDPILEYYKSKQILKVFSGTESNVIYPQVKTFLEDFLKKL
jgi:nucleoside-triphosphate--adenylate kinase